MYKDNHLKDLTTDRVDNHLGIQMQIHCSCESKTVVPVKFE